jgi:hypothetical protein
VGKFSADGMTMPWIRQFGAGVYDAANAVAADASGVYVVGETDGTLPGQTSAGGISDAFVRRYNADGSEVWTQQFGTNELDRATGVAADASGVYVIGETYGDLSGESTGGSNQGVFVRKYSADGMTVVWKQQFNPPAADRDEAVGIAVDASGVYVAWNDITASSAQLREAFLVKLDLDGSEQWQQITTDNAFKTEAHGVAVDASGVYLVGETGGTLPGQTSAGLNDAFVRKYGFDGGEQWIQQFGTNDSDAALAVAADASGVYVAGNTDGILPGQAGAGGTDAFVRKFDGGGNELWTSQFGTSGIDGAFGASANGSGVYVVGITDAAILGPADTFVEKFDASGNEVWTGVDDNPSGGTPFLGVAATASGVYVAGDTFGTFQGQLSTGGADAFVIKIVETVPPAAVRPGARVAGPMAELALPSGLPAQVGGAAPRTLALLSTAPPAPPPSGAVAEPLTGSGAPESLAAAWPGAAEGQDTVAPGLLEVGRVSGASADYPPDGAIPNDLLDGALLDWVYGWQGTAARVAKHG